MNGWLAEEHWGPERVEQKTAALQYGYTQTIKSQAWSASRQQ